MQNLELILSLAATALGLLVTTVTFFLKLISAIKAKTSAENAVKLDSALIPIIEQAEKLVGATGTEKKYYVLSQLTEYAVNNNLDSNLESVDKKIETLIELTKQVNYIKKGKAKNKPNSQSTNI